MANGHVEIHDLMSNHSDLNTCSTDGDAQNMEHTQEYRLLMAYAQRRRGNKVAGSPGHRGLAAQSGNNDMYVTLSLDKTETEVTVKKKKKKKRMKTLWKLVRCIKPKTLDEEPEQTLEPSLIGLDRSLGFGEDKDELEEAADQLTKIADDVPFIPPDIEADSPTNKEVEKLIGLLLRETGDSLNERELKDFSLASEFFWNYDFFRTLISTLLTRMGLMSPDPESLGPHASPKTQIAVTCEATSRLSAMDTLPMNRLLGYGARYLSEHYTSWAQEQGGYVEAFYSDDEDDDNVQ